MTNTQLIYQDESGYEVHALYVAQKDTDYLQIVAPGSNAVDTFPFDISVPVLENVFKQIGLDILSWSFTPHVVLNEWILRYNVVNHAGDVFNFYTLCSPPKEGECATQLSFTTMELAKND